ncbi:DUF1566 domain-containing protein [Mucilaginibacter sp. X4EP1]|uniref:DUF1566 domain-containing protein n=1 Tax=Mucilaginibacter sp. X4EP1 TaxID=2723092 RepID=UPI0021680BE6|nr:DUF1566 domain-containing protein [Mucilaginibacter sp. X4EP1]MCS3815499.1 hypothetical protein [Mucilaginibacter sp. X4EP1]
MKHLDLLKRLLLIISVATIALSCKKSSSGNGGTPTPTNAALAVSTAAITNITSSTATGGGTLSGTGDGETAISCDIVWDTNPNPTISSSSATAVLSGVGPFTSNLTGLSGGTTYYVRATAMNDEGQRVYGNQVTFTTPQPPIAIGQSYAGGIIFYVDNTGKHGLVVTPTDLSLETTWDNGTYSTVGLFTTNTAVGTGKANTATIVAALGTSFTNTIGTYPGYAALNASTVTVNGYSDWYLPSKDELTLMETNLSGFATAKLFGAYWSSSTESVPTYFAWAVSAASPALKQMSLPGGVRPIRAF